MDLADVYYTLWINSLNLPPPLRMVRGRVGAAFFVMLVNSVAWGSIPDGGNDFKSYSLHAKCPLFIGWREIGLNGAKLACYMLALSTFQKL